MTTPLIDDVVRRCHAASRQGIANQLMAEKKFPWQLRIAIAYWFSDEDDASDMKVLNLGEQISDLIYSGPYSVEPEKLCRDTLHVWSLSDICPLHYFLRMLVPGMVNDFELVASKLVIDCEDGSLVDTAHFWDHVRDIEKLRENYVHPSLSAEERNR